MVKMNDFEIKWDDIKKDYTKKYNLSNAYEIINAKYGIVINKIYNQYRFNNDEDEFFNSMEYIMININNLINRLINDKFKGTFDIKSWYNDDRTILESHFCDLGMIHILTLKCLRKMNLGSKDFTVFYIKYIYNFCGNILNQITKNKRWMEMKNYVEISLDDESNKTIIDMANNINKNDYNWTYNCELSNFNKWLTIDESRLLMVLIQGNFTDNEVIKQGKFSRATFYRLKKSIKLKWIEYTGTK